MAYEAEQAAFVESAWRTRLGYSGVPLQGVKEIQRFCGVTADLLRERGLTFLYTYVSAANYPTARSYIVNPQVNGQTYSGTWRLASVSVAEGDSGFVQVLRLGWATSIDWAEAYLVGGVDPKANERTLLVQWRNIAPASVKGCMDTLRAAGTYTDPIIQTTTHTGLWAVGNIEPAQSEDGVYSLTVTLVKVVTIASAATLKALTPSKHFVQNVKNPFGVEGGYLNHEPKAIDEGMVYAYPALSLASETFIRGMTGAQFQSLLSGTDANEYEYTQFDLTDNGQTLTLKVAFAYVPLKTTTPEADARYVSLVRHNQSGKLVLTRSWPRIDPSVALSLLTANANSKVTAGTVTDPLADSKTYAGDWLATTTQAPETEGEGVRIIQELVKAGDASVDVVCGADPDHKSYEFYRFDTTQDAIDEFLADDDIQGIDPKWETPESGITKRVQITKNADASLNLYAIYGTTSDLTHTDLANYGGSDARQTVGATYLVSQLREWGWNLPAAALKTLAAQYTTQEVNKRKDWKLLRRGEDTFDFEGTIETVTPQSTGEFTAEQDKAKKVTRNVGQNQTSLTNFTAPASPTAGVTVKVDHKKNELGSTDAVIETATASDQTSHSHEETAAKSVDVTRHTAAAAEEDATGQGVGVMVKAVNDQRPDGLFATEKTTERSKDIATIERIKSKAGTITIEKHTAAAADPSVPDPAVGKRYESSSEPNPDGTRRTALKTEEETDQSANDADNSLLVQVAKEKHTAAAAEASASGAAEGVRVRVENRRTATGAVESVKETQSGQSYDSGEFAGRNNGLVQEILRVLRGQKKADLPATLSAGEAYQAQLTERADYDVIRRRLLLGVSVQTSEMTSEVEFDPQQYQIKTPRYSVSTNPDNTKLLGYDYWLLRCWPYRIVTKIVVRTYSLSMPSVATVPTATGGSHGSGSSHHKRVTEVAEGVYAVEAITLSTGEWSGMSANKSTDWLFFISNDGEATT